MKSSADNDDQNLEVDALTAESLRGKLRCEDLKLVTSARLRMSSARQSLDGLCELLPHLTELKLDGSEVGSIRDLGRSASQLKVLWLSGCGLRDLGGIGAMEDLRELYAPFNSVADVSPLHMHPSLEVVDLDENKVASVGAIDFLASLKRLRKLHLQGNPVWQRTKYRAIVCSRIPHLLSLDDEPVTPADRKSVGKDAETSNDKDKTRRYGLEQQLAAGNFPGKPAGLTETGANAPNRSSVDKR